MTPVTLTVNGKQVAAMIEPRTHLRTSCASSAGSPARISAARHGVGCVHGPDQRRARAPVSPLPSPAADRTVRTIEGFDDALMQRLRSAARAGTLQCGFCTHGMLIASRDIVRRLPRPTRSHPRGAFR